MEQVDKNYHNIIIKCKHILNNLTCNLGNFIINLCQIKYIGKTNEMLSIENQV